MLILGIESSCDETAAAVVRNGREILSSVISSQIESHKPFGGVVPELASREHLEKIEFVIDKALSDADVKIQDSATTIRIKAATLINAQCTPRNAFAVSSLTTRSSPSTVIVCFIGISSFA